MRTLLAAGYLGKVYPVNPNENEILGLPCYSSIAEIKEPIDLIVICLPGKAVIKVMEEAEQRGDVKGVVVLSAGFAEPAIPENFDKPVVACFTVSQAMAETRRYLEETGIPMFDTPDYAVRALATLTQATFSVSHPLANVPAAQHPILDGAVLEARPLLEPEALDLLGDNGVAVMPGVLAPTREEAQHAAMEMKNPVVLKIVSPQVIHKSDIGGVKINLQGEEAVGQGYDQLVKDVKRATAAANVHGVLVVPMPQLVAAQYPQIKEIDLNPIRVYENGYSILDARILLDTD